MESAGILFRHCIFANPSRSDALVRFALKATIQQTEVVKVCTMNFVKVLACIMRTTDVLQNERVKIILPEMVNRVKHLLHRKQAGDAYFVHHCTVMLHSLCHRSDVAKRIMLNMRSEWSSWAKSCRYLQPITIESSTSGESDASREAEGPAV